MFERDSFLGRHELFAAAAVMAAHASATSKDERGGFRQRDVKFLMELCSNWVESSIDSPSLLVQNTQVQRYIQSLVDEGYLVRLSRGTHPRYRVTRPGFIELLRRIVSRSFVLEPNRFFFVWFFLNSHRLRLIDLIKREGREFPPALQIEVEALLDRGQFIRHEIQQVERELKKLDQRIKQAVDSSELVHARLGEGWPEEKILAELERKFPYELSNQKRLGELLHEFPEELRSWEMRHGQRTRAATIYVPRRNLLNQYLLELRRLRDESRDS